MTRRSLRVRLWIGAAASITVALLVAGLGLVTLFERHVERRIGDELRRDLNQLAAAIAIAPDGAIRLSREPLDPRFGQPLSGLYWQIDSNDQPGLLRSRSLWDEIIVLPADALEPGGVHAHVLPGPGGQRLLVRERRIRLQAFGQPLVLRLAVGQDRAELTAARDAFAADMRPYLGLIALVLALATLVQIQTGLAPLESVRRGVGAIRSGQERRLADDYPDEVMPLVSEVNALLDARAQAIERARAWTADLAHGLKTPLSALVADAERLRQQGHPRLAEDLEQLADTMRRRVDRELIRARVRSGAATHQARVDVVDAIGRLLRTLRRTPDGERLEWQIEAPPAAYAALMPDDLLELLGNLLENASKWARARVRVWVIAGPHARQAGAWIEIRVTDDGPGVPTAQMTRLGERGLRLDQAKEGTGLGLAIVRDVVDAYAGILAFSSASESGLTVSVRLPAAR
ncbi:HAMP domain-containing sensor histidine kinase [uncultured Thiocystis sp.]|jgi:signal transduction histidine kinase|uniref:sensor histidine kinase n=1 Tax=uncultured Thiocystis sp. TaxID=1202134 RepID=UPI0025F9CCA5|nr:HAMP domain-containing sensor histidine kinase [uncultured Thiocystis sp.]